MFKICVFYKCQNADEFNNKIAGPKYYGNLSCKHN